jgi:diguanylate cyclase (GGDEF)-like protein
VDVAKRRGEFAIFVVDREPVSAKELTDSLRASGYSDSRFYPTLDSALAVIRDALPHVVVIDSSGFENELESFLSSIREVSNEILVIAALPAALKLHGLQLVSRGLAYDTIVRPFPTSLELIQKIDRAVGRLYFQFETEQIKEFYEAKTGGQQNNEVPIRSAADYSSFAMAKTEAADASSKVALEYRFLNKLLLHFSDEKDVEETVMLFMEGLTRSLSDTPVLYFKYFAGHMSLLFSRATLLSNDTFRGLGIDLKKEGGRSLEEHFEHPATVPGMRKMVREVFKCELFSAFTHMDGDEVRGVFIILDEVEVEDSDSKVVCLKLIFDLAYRRNLVLKEKHSLDVIDQVTGLVSRRHFTKHLNDEVARARRLMMPLTLMVFSVDRYQELKDHFGTQQMDALLRSVAGLLKKSTRSNDVVARLGQDEFACLLPHTPVRGGAIKAERFRRFIELAKFPILEGREPLTVSCGVSEYPSFANDAEMLLQSADEALFEIKNSGGNKVCLSKAPSGFQTDFQPVEVPLSPRLGGGRG